MVVKQKTASARSCGTLPRALDRLLWRICPPLCRFAAGSSLRAVPNKPAGIAEQLAVPVRIVPAGVVQDDTGRQLALLRLIAGAVAVVPGTEAEPLAFARLASFSSFLISHPCRALPGAFVPTCQVFARDRRRDVSR